MNTSTVTAGGQLGMSREMGLGATWQEITRPLVDEEKQEPPSDKKSHIWMISVFGADKKR